MLYEAVKEDEDACILLDIDVMLIYTCIRYFNALK